MRGIQSTSLLAWCKWYFMLESWESKNTKTRHIGRSFCCSHIDLQTFTLNPIPNFYGTTFSSHQRQVQTSKFEIGLVLLHRNIDHLLIHRGVRNFGLRSHLLHKLFLLFEHELWHVTMHFKFFRFFWYAFWYTRNDWQSKPGTASSC